MLGSSLGPSLPLGRKSPKPPNWKRDNKVSVDHHQGRALAFSGSLSDSVTAISPEVSQGFFC